MFRLLGAHRADYDALAALDRSLELYNCFLAAIRHLLLEFIVGN